MILTMQRLLNERLISKKVRFVLEERLRNGEIKGIAESQMDKGLINDGWMETEYSRSLNYKFRYQLREDMIVKIEFKSNTLLLYTLQDIVLKRQFRDEIELVDSSALDEMMNGNR